ncbi:MAG: pyrroline-5-carboxylate reductase [Pseudomonadota bacterium]
MLEDLNRQGMLLLGCGKMGSALLQGWIDNGLDPAAITVIDPHPAAWLNELQELRLNEVPQQAPAVVLIAVKPQMVDAAVPQVTRFGGGKTLFLSIAAGTGLARFAEHLGSGTPIIRAMPNTPASIGQGITALVGNGVARRDHLALAEALLSSVGETVRLEDESQMDAVTALSGSGPAYVFHLIESLAAAGEAEGLPPELSMSLAKATVEGAGALARQADDTPEQLRINVTSPAGTTEAGLKVLMDRETGLMPLVRQTVAAAAHRSRELGK